MSENKNINLTQLAEEIYDLDAKVYETLGSSLGRVFNLEKQRTIDELVGNMESTEGQYLLRDIMALIGNMARTIPDQKQRHNIMIDYNRILEMTTSLPANLLKTEILDESRANLKKMRLNTRFGESDHYIIAIERSYGCGGKGIGFEVADRLRINYYEDAIFDEVLKRLQAEKEQLIDQGTFSYANDSDQKGEYVYTEPAFVPEKKSRSIKERMDDLNRYHGLPKRDAMYFVQSKILCDLAKKEDFVIMGHCADVILTKNSIPHISIFITAPFERRVERVVEMNEKMTEKRARALVKQQDEAYEKYYKFYTGLDWSDASNYDISVNSATYGIHGTAELIIKMLKEE